MNYNSIILKPILSIMAMVLALLMTETIKNLFDFGVIMKIIAILLIPIALISYIISINNLFIYLFTFTR